MSVSVCIHRHTTYVKFEFECKLYGVSLHEHVHELQDSQLLTITHSKYVIHSC